jgi:hypothetical protein
MRRSPRFEIALRVKLDFGDGETFEGKLGSLYASGEDVMVESSKSARVGDAVILEMPVPSQMRMVQCEGQVTNCEKSDDTYEIDFRIRNIDQQSKEELRKFCNFLAPLATSETIYYLIQEGEKALSEASEVTISESAGARLEALMHELLSLRYHDALRSFEDALKIDRENEEAVTGFCYSLAKAVSHYEQAGLNGLADIIKVKALQYYTDRTLEIAGESPRMDAYLLGIVRDIFSH